jgi:hypothetical protein
MTSKRMNIATPRKSKDGKTFWTTIGTAWFNDNGGIQLVFDALPIPDGEGRGLSPTCSSRASAMDVAIHEAEELFVRAGKAKIAAEAADLRRKRVRATLFVKYKGQGKGAGESEQMAEADPVYEAACVDWELAAYDAETLKSPGGGQADEVRCVAHGQRDQTRSEVEMNLR